MKRWLKRLTRAYLITVGVILLVFMLLSFPPTQVGFAIFFTGIAFAVGFCAIGIFFDFLRKGLKVIYRHLTRTVYQKELARENDERKIVMKEFSYREIMQLPTPEASTHATDKKTLTQQILRLLMAAVEAIDAEDANKKLEKVKAIITANFKEKTDIRSLSKAISLWSEDTVTLLNRAIQANNPSVVAYILALPEIDSNIRSIIASYWRTPLSYAIYAAIKSRNDSHIDIIKQLLKHPAINVHEAGEGFKEDPLREPISAGRTDIIDLILAAGALVGNSMDTAFAVDLINTNCDTDGVLAIECYLTKGASTTKVTRRTVGFEKAITTNEELVHAINTNTLKGELRILAQACYWRLQRQPDNKIIQESYELLTTLKPGASLKNLCLNFFNLPKHAAYRKTAYPKLPKELQEQLEDPPGVFQAKP